MKTLYLHIGTPKTATTAIQTFCWDNREILEKHGYGYPLFDYQFTNVQKYRNAHFLVGRIKDADGKRQFDEEQKVVREELGQVCQLFEQYDNIILSDEGIWNRGFFDDTNCWERLKQGLLKDDNIAVKVIVYLRRQDDFLFSWWNQQVKEGMLSSSVMSWEEVVEKMPYIKLDYYNILTKISEYVGKENITVRIFDKKSFVGGSIQADFLDALHLQYTDEYKLLAPMQNPSLTKNNVEIKRVLNTLPDLDKQKNSYFRKLLTEASAEGEEGSSHMFSEEEDRKFLEKYQEGNAKIAREYLGKDGALFNDVYRADGKWTPDNEQMIRDVIHFFGTTTLYLMNENKSLKEQCKSLKEQL
ncbi:MAG: hypothetical protein K2H34_04085, partial [Lachnospiraceae bacterium]|nr:hypothetical protein [Lachnospiraceae bacterium]